MKNSELVTHRTLLSRFKLNVISYGYGQFVTILLQLALIPCFLKYWGTELYADWLVLSGIPMMLTLLDLGVSQASANKATMRASAGDWITVRCSLQTAFVFTGILGGLVVLITMIANHFVDWQSLLKLKTITGADAALIMLLLSFNLIPQFLGGPIDGWFRAIDRTALGAFLLANRRMADLIVTVVVLMFGGGAVHLAMTMLVSQMLIVALLILVARHFSRYPILGFTSATLSELKSIFKPAIAYMSFPVSQTITLQGGIQLLNQVSDAPTLVGFTMSRTLMRLIIQIGVVANNALKPEISRLAGQGNLALAHRATTRLSRVIVGSSLIAYALAILIGPQFIVWWGHSKVTVGSGTLALVGVHAVLNVAWFVPAALLIAINKHVRIASAYVISSLFALFVWIAFNVVIPPILGASMLLAVPELIVLILFYFGRMKQSKVALDGL